MSPPKVTPEEALEFSEITFKWADSYDAKDWDRLRRIVTPTIMVQTPSLMARANYTDKTQVDYTEVTGKKWDSMSADEFVAMMSSPGFVGDPLVDTQHFLGGSKYGKTSSTEAYGDHQLRAAHQRYTGPDKKTVEAKGHGHAVIRQYYTLVDGEWKLSGYKPTVRWNEHNFEQIFKGDA